MSQGYITTDILMEHEGKIISDLYDFMLSEMKATVQKDAVDGILSSAEIHNVELGSDEHLKDFLAKKALSGVQDRFVAGYKTAESNIADLKYPAHERYFTVPENMSKLDDRSAKALPVKKMQILYGLCLLKSKRSPVESDTF